MNRWATCWYIFCQKWCMGSFCLKNRDFGPKDKRLRISRDVIKWLVIHSSLQDLSQKTICCLFLKAQRETKTDFGFSNREVENQIFLGFAFLLMKLSDYIMDRKRPLSFPFSTLCVVSDQTGIDHMLFQWVLDATQLFLMKMKNVGKQTIFDFLAFLYWRVRVVNFNWSLWDKT